MTREDDGPFRNVRRGFDLRSDFAGLDEADCFVEVRAEQFRVARNLEAVVQRSIERLVVDRDVLGAAGDSLFHGELLCGVDRERCGDWAFVAAVATNRGKHLGGHPLFEALGAFELRTEDEGVEPRFVDAVQRLHAALGFDLGFDEVFRVDVLGNSVAGLGEPKGVGNIEGDEERRFRGAERAHGNVLKREGQSLHGSLRLVDFNPATTTPIVAAGLAGWRTG